MAKAFGTMETRLAVLGVKVDTALGQQVSKAEVAALAEAVREMRLEHKQFRERQHDFTNYLFQIGIKQELRHPPQNLDAS